MDNFREDIIREAKEHPDKIKARVAYLEAMYKDQFKDDIPPLAVEYTLVERYFVLLEILDVRRNLRDMSEFELLCLQYKAIFDEGFGIMMMVHGSEEDAADDARECLRTRKPYEHPEEVQRLIDEGADF